MKEKNEKMKENEREKHKLLLDHVGELVQVLLEQLRHDEEVLLEVEEVHELQKAVLVRIALSVDELRKRKKVKKK